MTVTRDRILIVEHSPEVSDLIARQTLAPLGYHVEVARSAATAIQDIAHLYPDLIIANLKLPNLSGKDLLVALQAQRLDIPVILLADRGTEADIIQAFRLGAADYLLWPAREAEILSAVERVLKQVYTRREREALSRQLNQTNQELQKRVRELTTIFAVGKAVTSITDQATLLAKIIEGAVSTTEADAGWLLLREGNQRRFTLGAQRHLPEHLAQRVGQVWDDGISALVGLSGEPLSLHGEPLKRFKVNQLGQSVLVAPIKAKNEVIGLLTVIRKAAKPFSTEMQALIGAVADYASISIINARLFKTLDERARSLQSSVEQAQSSERQKMAEMARAHHQLQARVSHAHQVLMTLLAESAGSVRPDLLKQLHTIREDLVDTSHTIERLHE